MTKDELLVQRKLMQFWSRYIGEVDINRGEVSALLSKGLNAIDELAASVTEAERTAGYYQERLVAVTVAGDKLQEQIGMYRRALQHIVDAGNSEPAAADYAKDVLAGVTKP